MITRFYSFPTQQEFIDACSNLMQLSEHNEPEIIKQSHTYAIDEIGVIYKPNGVMLPVPDSDLFYPEQAPIAGWHVNVISNEPILPSEFEVFPNTPSRVFA